MLKRSFIYFVLLPLVLFFSFFTFCGCSKTESKNRLVIESTIPDPNYSSPEDIVKSYWAYSTWSDTVNTADSSHKYYNLFTKETKDNIYQEVVKNHEDAKKDLFRKKNYIDKIEKETDDRIIVYTQQLDYKSDTKFNKYKYVIKRENNKYLISEIWALCTICDGTGKQRDYSYLYSAQYKTCTNCLGTGWQEVVK